MRLLQIGDKNTITLTRDLLANDEVLPYAIPSHTWKEGEVSELR
jgi:hypothetical protein